MRRELITSSFLFKHWMSKCNSVFSLDCETTSLKYIDLEIVGFSLCDGKQVCYVDLKYAEQFEPKQVFLDILKFYLSESQLVIFHNSSFDLVVLRKYGVV